MNSTSLIIAALLALPAFFIDNMTVQVVVVLCAFFLLVIAEVIERGNKQ